MDVAALVGGAGLPGVVPPFALGGEGEGAFGLLLTQVLGEGAVGEGAGNLPGGDEPPEAEAAALEIDALAFAADLALPFRAAGRAGERPEIPLPQAGAGPRRGESPAAWGVASRSAGAEWGPPSELPDAAAGARGGLGPVAWGVAGRAEAAEPAAGRAGERRENQPPEAAAGARRGEGPAAWGVAPRPEGAESGPPTELSDAAAGAQGGLGPLEWEAPRRAEAAEPTVPRDEAAIGAAAGQPSRARAPGVEAVPLAPAAEGSSAAARTAPGAIVSTAVPPTPAGPRPEGTPVDQLPAQGAPGRGEPRPDGAGGPAVERLWGYWLRRGAVAARAAEGVAGAAPVPPDPDGAVPHARVEGGTEASEGPAGSGGPRPPEAREQVVPIKPAAARRPAPEAGLPGSPADAPPQAPAEPPARAPAEVSALAQPQPVPSAPEPNAVRAAPPAPPPAGAEAPRQVVRALRLHLGPGRDRISVQLEPERLGKVHLLVTREAQGLTAHFRVESPEAHQALLAEAPLLRRELEAQGLSLVRVSVDLDQGAGQGREPRSGRRGGRRAWHPAPGERLDPPEGVGPRSRAGFDARV